MDKIYKKTKNLKILAGKYRKTGKMVSLFQVGDSM